jgi:capsular exopolysaccharide synthesis family protein
MESLKETENIETKLQPHVLLKKRSGNFDQLEAFKTLRTNIEFSKENVKAICVTSALPDDGKSTTSFNLAMAFAESGKRTILIDADLRKSVMRRTVVSSGNLQYGLTHYLIGQTELRETVCVTSQKNLDIVFPGAFPPNPSELLGSERFRKMIDTMKKDFIVIIDTPPIGSVIDAAVVARACDGVVMVLKDGAISYRFAQRCKEQLESTGVPILGVVLNNVDLSSNRYYGNYYGKYYGSYYGHQ